MNETEMEYLAELIAQRVRETLENTPLKLDAGSLGHAAAEAINENRSAEGRLPLDL